LAYAHVSLRHAAFVGEMLVVVLSEKNRKGRISILYTDGRDGYLNIEVKGAKMRVRKGDIYQ
jgi:hypothetical protein